MMNESKRMKHFKRQIKNTLWEFYFLRVERNEMQSTLIFFSLLIFSLFFSFFDNFSQSSSILRIKESHVIFKVSKSMSKIRSYQKKSIVFYKISLWFMEKKILIILFYIHWESIVIIMIHIENLSWWLWRRPKDLPVRIVHYLVIVFNKIIIRWQRESIHWESLRYEVKR